MRIIYRMLPAGMLMMLLLGGRCAYGQGGATGAISGNVVDSSGGSVGGADGELIVRFLPENGSCGPFPGPPRACVVSL